MESLLEAIRLAIAPDAPDDAKSAGASACRTLLAALDTKGGEALVTPSPTVANMAAAISAMRELPPEQLLDLAIARLRAVLPTAPAVAPSRMKFHFVKLPPGLPGRNKP